MLNHETHVYLSVSHHFMGLRQPTTIHIGKPLEEDAALEIEVIVV